MVAPVPLVNSAAVDIFAGARHRRSDAATDWE
jgi:hypothetical protein